MRRYATLAPGQALDEAGLVDWLKPRLAHFKLPREVVFVDSLPRLGSGKVDRLQVARWVEAAAAE